MIEIKSAITRLLNLLPGNYRKIFIQKIIRISDSFVKRDYASVALSVYAGALKFMFIWNDFYLKTYNSVCAAVGR